MPKKHTEDKVKVLVITHHCRDIDEWLLKGFMRHDNRGLFHIELLCVGEEYSKYWEDMYDSLGIRVHWLPKDVFRLKQKKKNIFEKTLYLIKGIQFFSSFNRFDIINYHYVIV